MEREQALTTYTELFVQRRDAYSRQREHSRLYYHVKRPLTDEVLVSHLKGDITVGLHSIQQDGRTRWSVIDSDEGLAPLYDARKALQQDGVPSYVEQSRAGGHLWTFWQDPEQPEQMRKILSPYAQGRELFPAGEAPDGYGLVLRGPLGIHRASGQRYPFLDENGEPVSTGVVRGQLEWLAQNVVRSTPETLQVPLDVKETTQNRNNLPTPDHFRDAPKMVYESPIKQWCESVRIRDVVGEYVRLNRSGVDHCPWPEQHKNGDKHPSFIVYDRTQRFYCFTEQFGGNAADFLMRMENLKPREFVRRYCSRGS